jgi:hypothetical protein
MNPLWCNRPPGKKFFVCGHNSRSDVRLERLNNSLYKLTGGMSRGNTRKNFA